MTINRDAEENIRKSVKKIEERLKFYEKNYAIKDRQDLLAMCLIEIATKLESVNDSATKISNQTPFRGRFYCLKTLSHNQNQAGIEDYHKPD